MVLGERYGVQSAVQSTTTTTTIVLLFLEVTSILYRRTALLYVFTLGRGPVLWRMAPGLRAVLGAARGPVRPQRAAPHMTI